MAKVTAIKPQQRRRERVSVFLDGEFWTGMSLNCCQELGLKVGYNLSKKDQRQAERTVLADKALVYILDRLAGRPLSEAQMREKLAKRDFNEAIIKETMTRCQNLGLIDDKGFALAVAEQKKEQGYGQRRAEEYLRRAGIEQEIIRETLSHVFAESDEQERARSSLTRRYQGPLNSVEQRRALAFLVRRGFGYAAGRKAVEGLAMDHGEEEALKTAAQAREILKRRYRNLNTEDPKERQKAYNYLVRRGFASRLINEALSSGL